MKSELRFQLAGRRSRGRDEHAYRLRRFPDARRNRLRRPESFASITGYRRTIGGHVHRARQGADPSALHQLPSRKRSSAAGRRGPAAPAAGRRAARTAMAFRRCAARVCHKHANFEPGRMPGHPEWHLAPREMAWEGKTVAEICAQIKDPARNGGRKLEELIHHIGEDTLVGWAWAPGARPQPRARHAEAGRCAGRGLGENRRGLSRAVTFRRSCDRQTLPAMDSAQSIGIMPGLRGT